MPSDKCNLIMVKATELIFLLVDVALAQKVPFGIPQYVNYILHGLTSVLLCVPFILADSQRCLLFIVKLSVFFVVATEVLFEHIFSHYKIYTDSYKTKKVSPVSA